MVNDHRYLSTGSDLTTSGDLYWWYDCGHPALRGASTPDLLCGQCGSGQVDTSLYLVRVRCGDCSDGLFYPLNNLPQQVSHRWGGHRPRPMAVERSGRR